MSKRKRIIISFVIFYVTIIILYTPYGFNYKVNEVSNIMLIFTFIPSLIFYILSSKKITQIFKTKIKTIYEDNKFSKIKEISQKYKELQEINSRFTFNDLGNNRRKIVENEYSRKSYDRARASEIIIYKIENNEDNIREFILNAFRNKKIYDKYIEEVSKIAKETKKESIEALGISQEKFHKLENQLIKNTIIPKDVYDISVEVEVVYITKSGYYSSDKNRIVNYNELCELYMKWRNGKKYEETSKRERKYMNDSLRYDVLKRDEFKCKICGISSNEGAKLHVDHIIPVSKGGKTTMSNLQTLCDRCNKGKGNK